MHSLVHDIVSSACYFTTHVPAAAVYLLARDKVPTLSTNRNGNREVRVRSYKKNDYGSKSESRWVSVRSDKVQEVLLLYLGNSGCWLINGHSVLINIIVFLRISVQARLQL